MKKNKVVKFLPTGETYHSDTMLSTQFVFLSVAILLVFERLEGHTILLDNLEVGGSVIFDGDLRLRNVYIEEKGMVRSRIGKPGKRLLT